MTKPIVAILVALAIAALCVVAYRQTIGIASMKRAERGLKP